MATLRSHAGASGLMQVMPNTAKWVAKKIGIDYSADMISDPGTNLRTETLEWLEPQKQINYYPTVRGDYQISSNLSLMSSYNR